MTMRNNRSQWKKIFRWSSRILSLVLILMIMGCAKRLPPSPMSAAIRAGDVARVTEYSKDWHRLQNDSYQNYARNIPPLAQAIEVNNAEIVRILLKAGADPNNRYNSMPIFNTVFFHRDAKKPPNEIFMLLFDNNEKVNYHIDYKTKEAPVYYVMSNGYLSSSNIIYRSRNPDSLSESEYLKYHYLFCPDEFSPLICSIQLGMTDWVKILLNKGADINLKSGAVKIRDYYEPINPQSCRGDGGACGLGLLSEYLLLGPVHLAKDMLARTYEPMNALEWAQKRVDGYGTRRDFSENLDQAPVILNLIKQFAASQKIM